MNAQKSSPLPIILVVVGVVLVVVVAVVGILAALGIFGVRRYLDQAKSAEGRASVTELALGIVSCAETDPAHALPESSPSVPPNLSDVSGKKYMSSAADWSAPAFSCGKFRMSAPQYFQYSWVKESATSGRAEARADFDGNGRPDVVFDVPITCSDGKCTNGSVIESRP
jgi:type IV pilus assembly protein PilA